jgi:type VI secretion system secreted protein Hcp
MAQVDYFLKIDTVTGESSDSKHKGEIEVQSFSWGETQTGTAGHGGGGGAGKVVPQDLTFSKKMDKSSPVLFISCATGVHFKDAVFVARKAGAGAQQEYLKITMEEVLISNYNLSGSDGSDNIPNESISLNFAKLEISYKVQNPDGTLGAEVKQKYDFAQNVKV